MAPDPYRYFRLEARDLLSQISWGILGLEKDGNSNNQVQRLLRYAHTLKGAARVVKLTNIADSAHAIEDALSPVRAPGSTVPREIVEKTLRLLDEIEALYKPISTPPSAAVAVQTPQAVPVDEQFRTVRADITEMDALLDGVVETHTILNRLRNAPRQIAEGSQLVTILLAQLSQRSSREKNQQTAATLDRAHTTADELRKLLSRLESTLGVAVDQMDRELHQLRGSAEQLRLLPASSLFSALERLARDVASSQGKKVSFETSGGDIHLDGYVLNALQGPLVQILRNAIAHGIESESDRRAGGKTPDGKLRLSVFRRAGQIVLRFEDDGRGIDMPAVRKKAEEAGLITVKSPVSDEELKKLLLRGGISTSSRVTDAAGRGVGLDVVNVAVAELGGAYAVETQPNKGTVFELTVPVSVSAIEELVVGVGDDMLTLPLEAVRTCMRVNAAEISSGATGASILYEGQAVPFVSLARALYQTPEPPRTDWTTIVVGDGDGRAAFGVDGLKGIARTVVRPMSQRVPASPLVVGASLDSEGNPQLVLDPHGLVTEAPRIAMAGQITISERTPILVVDDSLTTRMLEQSILESAGYAVDVAASGEEGLEVARRKTYALMLVDVEMPGIDGFTFVEQVRNDPVLHQTPIILVTSRNAPEDIRRGEEVRANGYVVKGEFNQARLLSMIRPLVGDMSKIRVLIVEDSLTVRGHLVDILSAHPEFEVVADVGDGKAAIECVLRERPDVITMDMMMPVMTGLAATEYIMAHCPTPILVVSASINRGELFRTYDALAAGAVDVLEKPKGDEAEGVWEKNFLATLKLVSRIKVITHYRGRLKSYNLDLSTPQSIQDDKTPRYANPFEVVAIGASTGGPGAIVEVLQNLPDDFRLPILFVLHINEPFGVAFADWLDAQTSRRVVHARDGQPLSDVIGRVVMAPGHSHMIVKNGRLRLTKDPERHSCRPSVDVLFESVAQDFGSRAAACLLTGMGRDGADGLLEICKRGGMTIAQDEASSVIYGMPREAVILGAAQHVFPLADIGPALARLTSANSPGRTP